MKTLKHHFLFGIITTTFLFSACRKTETHNISGVLYNNCEAMEPVPDILLEFAYSPKHQVLYKPHSFRYTTRTKSDGSFEFEFEEKPWSMNLYENDFEGAVIRTVSEGQHIGRYRQLSGIPPGKVDVGNLVRKRPLAIKAYAKIDFVGLSSTDTVIIQNRKTYVSPFTQLYDTLTFSEALGFDQKNPYPHYGEKMKTRFRWAIHNNGVIIDSAETVLVEPCDTLINIDIVISK